MKYRGRIRGRIKIKEENIPEDKSIPEERRKFKIYPKNGFLLV
jgi:hypothetical protein